MNFQTLNDCPRLLLEVSLQPASGRRFQPTGFADIGAAEFRLPGAGTPMLLVESAQSVANRLEKTILDGDGPELDPALVGLPYVCATLSGTGPSIQTSSLVEAHRIASPYFIYNKEFQSRLTTEMNYSAKSPLNWPAIYATLFKYDINSLIHGVFLSLLEGGRVRSPRALTGFIEAANVERVLSGGVKNSPIDPTGKTQVAGQDADSGVYSNVPYPRIEYVAASITAYFNLDLSLIRGYRIGDSESQRQAVVELLTALSLLKIRRFLAGHLRLRTACDFLPVGEIVRSPAQGFTLPSETELLGAVNQGIQSCKSLFANPPVTRLETPVKIAESRKGKAKPGSSEDPVPEETE